MALAVLFLLLGILATEVAMLGIHEAGIAGVVLLLVSAGLLLRLHLAARGAAPARVRVNPVRNPQVGRLAGR